MAALVESRKEEYAGLKSYKEKGRIAVEVHNTIISRGGRFLRNAKTDGKRTSVLCAGAWVEVEKDASLEKIKQALREKPAAPPDKGGAKRRRENEDGGEVKGGSSEDESLKPSGIVQKSEAEPELYENSSATTRSSSPVPSGSIPPAGAARVESSAFPVQSSSNILPASLLASVGQPTVDFRLVLFQTVPFAFHKHVVENAVRQAQLKEAMAGQAALQNAYSSGMQHGLLQRQLAENMFRSQLHEAVISRAASVPDSPHEPVHLRHVEGTAPVGQAAEMVTETPVTMEEVPSSLALDGDISELLLSMLGYSDETIFTEQDEERERLALTEEERLAATSDMFGHLCLSSNHQSKKAKRDLDGKTLSFFVKQMRAEIEMIPQNKKRALVEAQKKCRDDEFSDERLEQFLRFEGMNPKVSSMPCMLLQTPRARKLILILLSYVSLELSALSTTGRAVVKSLAKRNTQCA